jgi:DDE domain/DDE superfamily endonuclease
MDVASWQKGLSQWDERGAFSPVFGARPLSAAARYTTALPRVGWGRKAPRARLLTRPLRQSQIKRDASLTRPAGLQDRSWSRLTSGGLRSVIGAVQDGTSQVFSQIVPHFDPAALRQSMHHVMPIFGQTDTEGMMVVDRSGIQRAKQLASTLAHEAGHFPCHLLPAHCGHHLNPIAGVWRVRKDAIGAGRCFSALHQLYWRTRQVLMAHPERPIYAFHWYPIPPRTSRDLLVAYPLSYRHVEELMEERGVPVDHATIQRWVVKYSPQLEDAFHRRKRPVWVSWCMDETYIRVKGPWYFLYRAVDKHGQTIDFLLTEHRDTEAALWFLKQAIRRNGLPEIITIDGSDANEAALKRSNEEHGTAIAIRQVK